MIRATRPADEVAIFAPEDAARELERLDPDLAICSFPSDLLPGGRPAWVEFRPYEQPQARVCVGGRRREISEVDLGDFLAVADETEARLRKDPAAGGC